MKRYLRMSTTSADIRRDLLELEKLRQEIETELARRHNWAEQERFWGHEAKMSRTRNYILAVGVASSIVGALAGAIGWLIGRGGI
jgi:hypothetical protein